MGKAPKRQRLNQESTIDPTLARELVEEALQTDNLGFSTDPADHIWIGEDGKLDPDDWIHDYVGPIHSLEGILRPIIEAHPNPTLGTTQERLEQALKALVAFLPRRGPKPRRWATLLLIAKDWWEQHCRGEGDPNLTALIRCHVSDLEGSVRFTEEQEKNQIKAWSDEFRRHKDLLLKVVSGSDADEQRARRFREQRILELLRFLGVSSKAGP